MNIAKLFSRQLITNKSIKNHCFVILDKFFKTFVLDL